MNKLKPKHRKSTNMLKTLFKTLKNKKIQPITVIIQVIKAKPDKKMFLLMIMMNKIMERMNKIEKVLISRQANKAASLRPSQSTKLYWT
jgi:hypothetical protein